MGCCIEKTQSSVCVFGSVTSHLTNKVQNATSEDTPTAGTAAAVVSHGFTALHTHSFNSGFQKSVVQRTLPFRGTTKTPWFKSPDDITTVYPGRGASKEIHIYLQLLVPRSDSIKKTKVIVVGMCTKQRYTASGDAGVTRWRRHFCHYLLQADHLRIWLFLARCSSLWSWQEVCALHHCAWTWMELCAQAQDWILQPTASDGFSFSLKLITPGGRRQHSCRRCTHLHGCLCETLHSPVTCNQTFLDVSVQRSFVDVLVKHSWWMGFLLHPTPFWKKVKVNALLKASIVTHIGIMEWNKMLRTKNVSA